MRMLGAPRAYRHQMRLMNIIISSTDTIQAHTYTQHKQNGIKMMQTQHEGGLPIIKQCHDNNYKERCKMKDTYMHIHGREEILSHCLMIG